MPANCFGFSRSTKGETASRWWCFNQIRKHIGFETCFEHLPLAFWTAMHMNFILFYTSWVFMILFRKYLSQYLWNFKLWKPLAFWLQVTNSGGRPWRQVRQMEVESGVRVLAERPAEDFEPTEEEASPECLAAWSLKNQDWRTLRWKLPQKRWISQNVFDFTVSDIWCGALGLIMRIIWWVYHTLRAGDVFSCLNWQMLGQIVRS